MPSLIGKLAPLRFGRRLITALPARVVARVYAIPRRHTTETDFDIETERLFRRERQAMTLSTLKPTLLTVALGVPTYLLLDKLNGGNTGNPLGALLFIGVALGLCLHLQRCPHPQQLIALSAKLAVAAAIIGLSLQVLLNPEPTAYHRIWTGLLPIYFFIYGQLFMPLAQTVALGWLAMLFLSFSAYAGGISTAELLSSAIILLLVNFMGYCTRYQLESHARRAFLAKRRAEAAAQCKNQFLQQFSHNLRQPLQALSCYASVLECLSHSTGGELPTVAAKMGGAIDELNLAFNNILQIANLEAGQQQPILTAVNINAVLTTLRDQFAPLATARNLKLYVRLRQAPPYSIHTDPVILKQVLSNLLDNAIKYTEQGWVVVGTAKISDSCLKLHICDSGIGIGAEHQHDIFQEFYRAQGAQSPGLGIGLCYVRKAVENLPGHQLDFASRPGRGSDFQLRLPLAAPGAARWPQRKSAANLQGIFVFIIDDDDAAAAVLAQELSCCGCLVQTAASKPAALQLLAENLRPPDLLICDYYLTAADAAADIILDITALYGPLPTIVLTTQSIPDSGLAQWPAHIRQLRKPVCAADLHELIGHCVHS